MMNASASICEICGKIFFYLLQIPRIDAERTKLK